MRIAAFSDVHGNSIALDAVLAEVSALGGVDAWWFVGDAVGLGFDPVGTVERLSTLPNLVGVRGNGDRRLATDSEVVREITARRIAMTTPEDAATWQAVLAESEWTRALLRASGGYEWVAALPLETRLTLPDGTRLLLVHASPGMDEGPGIHADLDDGDLRAMLAGVEADLVITGHTHRRLVRVVDGVQVVNLGSLSNPPGADKRATWSLVEATPDGVSIQSRATEYDLPEVRRQMVQRQVPSWSYVRRYLEGAS